jgi:uncharacterized protein
LIGNKGGPMVYQDYPAIQDRVKDLFYRVYGWMTMALLLTAFTSLLVASNQRWMITLLTRPYVSLMLLLVQLIVVIVFATMLPRLAYFTALLLFIAYALLSGITLSFIFYTYSLSSILQALVITAGMFASTALYGYFTNTDLSKMGSILRMALWGMILALLVNLFVRSTPFNLIISWVGVVLFSALTAYDVYMIKQYAIAMEERGSEEYGKVGLLGAFTLYLDFINLFLSLLGVMGKRRE